MSSNDQPPGATGMLVLTLAYRLVFLALMFAGAIALIRWGLVPLAREIKGTETKFDFNFGFSLSLLFNAALGTGLVVSEVDRRKVKKQLGNKKGRPKR